MGFSEDGNGQVLVVATARGLFFGILCFLFMDARTLEQVAGTR